MRLKLRKLGNDERHKFTATVRKFGHKNGYKCILETVLLTNVKLDGELLCGHLWINKTKGFIESSATINDTVEFRARVSEYFKGYKGYDFYKQLDNPIQKDYKLEYPTKFKVINKRSAIWANTLVTIFVRKIKILD